MEPFLLFRNRTGPVVTDWVVAYRAVLFNCVPIAQGENTIHLFESVVALVFLVL